VGNELELFKEKQMKMQAYGSYEQGVADVDPVAAPATILSGHYFNFQRKVTKSPTKLILQLLGTGAETLTVTLYALAENLDEEAKFADYATADARWYQFAAGVVVTNGALQTVTSGLPAGGTVYARRTADTIGAAETRKLALAWM
jgi:hypothetical protein